MPQKNVSTLRDLTISIECISSRYQPKGILTTCHMHQHILHLIDKALCNCAQARKVIPVSPMLYVNLLAHKPRNLLGGTVK